jgi:hypothetical protein
LFIHLSLFNFQIIVNSFSIARTEKLVYRVLFDQRLGAVYLWYQLCHGANELRHNLEWNKSMQILFISWLCKMQIDLPVYFVLIQKSVFLFKSFLLIISFNFCYTCTRIVEVIHTNWIKWKKIENINEKVKCKSQKSQSAFPGIYFVFDT